MLKCKETIPTHDCYSVHNAIHSAKVNHFWKKMRY